MPNFKCKNLKELSLPLTCNGVCFHFLAKNESSSLIYASFEGVYFFIQILRKSDCFLVRVHEDSKTLEVGFIQKALLEFKNTFCEDIISDSSKLNKNRLLSQNHIIMRDTQALISKFKCFDKVFVEIGFGSGRHLLFRAKQDSKSLFVGIETYASSVEQVAKLAISQGLDNLSLINTDARLLFSILPSNSLSGVYLHFPVPWLKQEHRRVVSKDFIQDSFRVLKKDAFFELRTDSKEYFDFSWAILSKIFAEKIDFSKNENLQIVSKYEQRWLKQDKDIYTIKAICTLNSDELIKEDFNIEALSFSSSDLEDLKRKFKPKKFKGDDFFISLQELFFINDKSLLLRLSLGAFSKPSQVFLLLGQRSEFLFKKPTYSRENVKALKQLEALLINS